MLTDILEYLGVHMTISDATRPKTHEDLSLMGLRGQALEQEIARRDSLYKHWGFKNPNIWEKLHQWDRFSPKYIFIFRDPVAYNLNGRPARITPTERREARRAADETLKALEAATNRTCILLSYEKILLYPERTIYALCEYLKIKYKPGVIEIIKPEKGYHNG